MKQSFKTSKLYYGFPIFILGYQDQNFGYNITTCSSSYSLGDWLYLAPRLLGPKLCTRSSASLD